MRQTHDRVANRCMVSCRLPLLLLAACSDAHTAVAAQAAEGGGSSDATSALLNKLADNIVDVEEAFDQGTALNDTAVGGFSIGKPAARGGFCDMEKMDGARTSIYVSSVETSL